ncbi:IS21 family transposase [bacterium]|nr:IS21 family transposase [bacterium]
MLPMIDIYNIKILAKNKENSLREIVRETGHSFNTVKKYIEINDFNIDLTRKVKKKHSKLDPFKETLISWIKNDSKAPRKQKHTVKRMHHRLTEQFGDKYNVSYRALCDYVVKLKKELQLFKNEGMVPLKHPPGTAQLDFGKTSYILNDVTIEGYHLVISFPFSNMGFAQLFPAQNQEALFQGMKNIFEYIGGVPKEIWFDNMSTAVVKVGKGQDRTLTEMFMRFAAHYGFNSKFCNPAKGNEKGSVENKVGYIRNNFFVPVPQINNLNEYNEELLYQCSEDAKRKHYKKNHSIEKLFLDDQEHLILLNEIEFAVLKQEKRKVDNVGYIRFQSNSYSVHPKYAKKEVWIKIYYDRLEILDESYKLITKHQRSYKKNQEYTNWELWIDTFIEKPRAFEQCEYFDSLPLTFKSYFKSKRKYEDKRKFLSLLGSFLIEDSFEMAAKVLEGNLASGITDLDSFKAAYLAKLEPNKHFLPLDLKENIPLIQEYEVDLIGYDKFLGGR